MKNIKINILYLTVIVFLASCSDFGDLNENPNEPTKVGTETLLTSAQRSVASVVGSYVPVLYVQHMSEITYTEDSRYGSTQANFNGWYTGPLANLQVIIDLNTNDETRGDVLSGGSNANQIGVAQILQSYFFIHVVDRWGPVPFDDALKGTDILLPSYNSEEQIYSAVFATLKSAAASLDGGPIEGDIILDGDTDSWKQFANTLRATMAMRVADVNPSLAQSEFQDAVNGGIFSETVAYNYLGEAANENPWFARFRTRTDYALSNVFVDFLNSTNDPRINSFGDVAASSGLIAGMPYGLENSEVQPTDVSFPNSVYVKAQDADIPIFSETQIKFMMAEAAERGWIGSDAETHYNDAITASMNQWGITDAGAIADFLAQESVKYNSANWKESIGMQKWVALYTQGYEAWAEWRRLDYPVLQSAEAPLNPSEDVPVRNMYPASEATLNGANYEAALGMIGGTNTDGVKVWWDVN